jgi:hypothetical protein
MRRSLSLSQLGVKPTFLLHPLDSKSLIGKDF